MEALHRLMIFRAHLLRIFELCRFPCPIPCADDLTSVPLGELADSALWKIRAGALEAREIISQPLNIIFRAASRSYGLRWSRLSEQIFRVDKWSLCRG